MSLRNPIEVRMNPLWDLAAQFQVWQFRCDLRDNGMEFAAHPEAIERAHRHAMKHKERACPGCGHSPYIREDFQ